MAPTSKRGCGPWLSGRVANPSGLHDQLPSPGGVMLWMRQCPATEPLSRANRFCRFGGQSGGASSQHGRRSHARPGGGTNAELLINCLPAAAETAGWHNWGTQHRGENRPDGGRRYIRRDRHPPPAGGRERFFPCCRIQQPWRRPRWPSVGRPTGTTPGWRQCLGCREPVDRGAGARPVGASVPRRPGDLPPGWHRATATPCPGTPCWTPWASPFAHCPDASPHGTRPAAHPPTLRREPAPSHDLRPAHRAIPNASGPRGRHRGAEPLIVRSRRIPSAAVSNVDCFPTEYRRRSLRTLHATKTNTTSAARFMRLFQ